MPNRRFTFFFNNKTYISSFFKFCSRDLQTEIRSEKFSMEILSCFNQVEARTKSVVFCYYIPYNVIRFESVIKSERV